jgi:valyl-tRNA synthetase
MDFGTGVVKITPAHDPNDFEVGLRHNLPVINVMTEDAKINHEGLDYEGLTREEARHKIVADLKSAGLLIKTEPHQHNVGACYRCRTVVEPRVSFQWFVKMKPLAEPAIAAVKNGETKFVPERFDKTYFNWMENIRDWCISRQLWWGHRIPAYYCDTCGKIMVGREMPDICPDCGGTRFRQDEDTLDTWFSSALWPFSTLGWPQQTEDLKFFYPTSVLVTGYDIIFFWVARMIFSGIEHTGHVPFHTVFIHGIVRDSEGRKMSKSLGNGVDPLELIDEYGADALRYALVSGNAPGNDQRFQADKIEAGRNFINKIWNAFRFVVLNFDDVMDLNISELTDDELALEDKWILTKLQLLKEEVNHNLEKYELGVALAKIYSFLWEEYCDWYIEMCKARLSEIGSRGRHTAQTVLNHVLSEALQLLHPFMPFVTEEIYNHLKNADGSIMVSSWPVPVSKYVFEKEASKMTILMDAVRSIRNVRTEMQVPFSRKVNLLIVSEDRSMLDMFRESEGFLQRLAGISGLETRIDKKDIPTTAVTAVFDGGEIFMPLEDLIDIEKEIVRLRNEQQNLEKELDRVRGKLANEAFVSKAPEKIINAEKEKLARYEAMYQSTAERLEILNGL